MESEDYCMNPKPNIVNLPVYKPGKPIDEVKKGLGLSEVIKLASMRTRMELHRVQKKQF